MTLLCLLLPSALIAQNKAKSKDLYGDWYLNFKYAEITPKGTKEEPLFNYTKELCAEGGDTKAYSYHEPIRLTLMEGGNAKLYYKEVLEIKSIEGAKITGHTLSIFRTELPLRWYFEGGRFHFSPIKAKNKGVDRRKYEVTQTHDEQELVGTDVYFGDIGYEGIVDMFTDELIEHLLSNLNKMKLEHYTPNAFVLNGRNTFKELKGYAVEPFGMFDGWRSNIVYVTKEKPQEIGKMHQATDAELKAISSSSEALASHFMKTIAPMSGKNPKAHILGHRVHENEDGRYISSTVTLTWEARDWPSIPYGTCEATGSLKLYPPVRSIDKWKVEFVLQDKNDHAARVSTPSQWDNLKRIVFDF